MRDGGVEQVGPPMEVYRRPASTFVAGFVGSPAMNLLEGVLTDGRWRGPGGLVLAAPSGAAGRVTLGVRPHDLAIVGPGTGDADARVDVVEPRGSELLVHVRLGADGAGSEVRVVAPPEPLVPVESVVGLRATREQLHWFDEVGKRISRA
jgi:ABC-type sugar transport system ATPase subunit